MPALISRILENQGISRRYRGGEKKNNWKTKLEFINKPYIHKARN